MRAKLIFLAGAATGFVLGSKAGRGAYDKIKAKATETLEDPKVRRGFESAGEFVSSQAPVVGHKLQEAASSVASKVKKNKDKDAEDTAPSTESASDGSASTGSSSDGNSSDSGSGDNGGGDNGDEHGPMTPATPAP